MSLDRGVGFAVAPTAPTPAPGVAHGPLPAWGPWPSSATPAGAVAFSPCPRGGLVMRGHHPTLGPGARPLCCPHGAPRPALFPGPRFLRYVARFMHSVGRRWSVWKARRLASHSEEPGPCAPLSAEGGRRLGSRAGPTLAEGQCPLKPVAILASPHLGERGGPRQRPHLPTLPGCAASGQSPSRCAQCRCPVRAAAAPAAWSGCDSRCPQLGCSSGSQAGAGGDVRDAAIGETPVLSHSPVFQRHWRGAGGAARGSGEVQAGEGGLCPPSPTAASGRLCSWTWLDKLQNTRLHEISR